LLPVSSASDRSRNLSHEVCPVRPKPGSSSHGNAMADEVAECLAEMATARLIDVFRFDSRSGRYEPLSPAPLTADGLQASWFLISAKGRRELEANWVDD